MAALPIAFQASRANSYSKERQFGGGGGGNDKIMKSTEALS